jgi:hypothetical protein
MESDPRLCDASLFVARENEEEEEEVPVLN